MRRPKLKVAYFAAPEPKTKEDKGMAVLDHHEFLWRVCQKLPGDYTPYGEAERNLDCLDCSCGCVHYYLLESRDGQPLGLDWGVCVNPKSHRCGLLTFEHQGCSAYEGRPD